MLMAVGAGHGDIDQRQIQRFGMCLYVAFKLIKIHRHHGFNGRIKFGQFEFHAFDDEAMVVCQ